MKIGDYVKVFCQGGLIEAGTLVKNSDEEMVLDLIDGTQTIIMNPKRNVIAIKVSHTKDVSRDKTQVYVDADLEVGPENDTHELRFKAKAELVKMKAHEERQRARELLTTFIPTGKQEVNFGTPSFAKPVSEHSASEVRRRIRRHRKGTL